MLTNIFAASTSSIVAAKCRGVVSYSPSKSTSTVLQLNNAYKYHPYNVCVTLTNTSKTISVLLRLMKEGYWICLHMHTASQNTKMRDKAPCMFPTLTWCTTLQSRLPHYHIIYTSDGLSEGSRQICDWFES